MVIYSNRAITECCFVFKESKSGQTFGKPICVSDYKMKFVLTVTIAWPLI